MDKSSLTNGLGNGLAQNKRWAIAYTTDGYQYFLSCNKGPVVEMKLYTSKILYLQIDTHDILDIKTS